MTTPIDWHALDPKERIALSLGNPNAFFVTGEDWIQLAALNSAAGVTLLLAGRFMQLNGEVTSFTHYLTPATDRTLSSATTALGNGFILNLTVRAFSGSPQIGQCWARVQVYRGQNTTPTLLGTLAAGYVTYIQPLAYPAGIVRGSLDGPGAIRSITGSVPAAGAEILETVPAGARWRFLSLRAELVTSVDAANRVVTFVFDDGVNVFAVAGANFVQAASLGRIYDVGAYGILGDLGNARVAVAAPADLVLPAGARIRSLTQSLQAADEWSAPQLLVEEWIEGA